MKKIFAIIALMGVFTFGMTQTASAQDESSQSSLSQSRLVCTRTSRLSSSRVLQASWHS